MTNCFSIYNLPFRDSVDGNVAAAREVLKVVPRVLQDYKHYEVLMQG